MSSEDRCCYTRIRRDETPPCKFPFFCTPVCKKEKDDDDDKPHICCKKKTKWWFQTECPLPKIDADEVCCVYRPLFKIGLLWVEVLRHLLFPVSCGSPVVHAKSKDGHETGKTRASDLPLYTEELKPVPCASNEPKRSLVEETIGCVRQELQILISQGKVVKSQIDSVIIAASAQTKGTVEYLQAEENSIPRYGAIALGSAAGYIMALRRGIFKKIIYTTAGGASVAALAYPREAQELVGEALNVAKKYFVIGYHFMNGVTTDLLGVQLPALPIGHLVISDKPHPPPDAVPSSAHLMPPVATPSHIPLPNEDQHTFEIKKHPKTKD